MDRGQQGDPRRPEGRRSEEEGDPSLEEDQRTLIRFLWWLCACAFIGGALLIFAIWVDWA